MCLFFLFNCVAFFVSSVIGFSLFYRAPICLMAEGPQKLKMVNISISSSMSSMDDSLTRAVEGAGERYAKGLPTFQ